MSRTYLIALLLSISLMGLASQSCAALRGAPAEKVIVAVPPLEQNALLYVAESRGFFANRGLDVVINDYDSGVTSIGAVLQGKADLAETAEFPVVTAALRNEPIQIIACNDRFENDYVVARADRGIASIPDLKGKRIGVTLGTVNEFNLGRVLGLSDLSTHDVELVNITPAQFVSAIVGGEVDAIVVWQPYVNRIQESVPGVLVWPAQSSQSVYGILSGRGDWIAAHTDTVDRFLRALVDAESYLVRHRDEAMAIVQKRLGYDSEYVASVWSQHHFAVSLDLSLVTAMDVEAHWAIANNLATDLEPPDFRAYLYTEGLGAVKPEVVTIAP